MIANRANGSDVLAWQRFLLVEGIVLPHGADGEFGGDRQRNEIVPDPARLAETGALNDDTLAAALSDGFMSPDRRPRPCRPIPPFSSPTGRRRRRCDRPPCEARRHLRPAGLRGTPGADDIIITNNFAENIIPVDVPQLRGVWHAPKNGACAGTRRRRTSCVDSGRPGKGSDSWRAFSNGKAATPPLHTPASRPAGSAARATDAERPAFGAAFDVNVEWNALGATPALVGTRGSVRELVPSANRLGLFWGGHYDHRKDSMHFEVAKLMTRLELDAAVQSLS